MLTLKNKSQLILKQWQDYAPEQSIVFITHATHLIHYFESENSITVFYGLLDQDIQSNNPAQHLNEQITRQGMKVLSQCYGSFIVIHCHKYQGLQYMANDAMGDFALHYRQESNTIYLSDFPEPLIKPNDVSLNERRLLHYFAITKPQNNACFFKCMTQLNPGHYLTLKNKSITSHKYYNPPNDSDFKHTNIDKLAIEFKRLIQSVIKFQSQGQNKVAVMMSGGLDSTFVMANGLKTGLKINTYSYVFPNMDKANESMWIDSLRNHPISMHTFSAESQWPLKSPWFTSVNSPIANPYRLFKNKAYQGAHNAGIQTVFTGVFADHLYTGYLYWLVDQIKSNPFKAIQSFYNCIETKGLKYGLKQISPAKWSHQLKINSPWLNKKSLAHLKSITSTHKYDHPHPQQFALTYGPSTAQSAWLENEHAYLNGIVLRHPFRDRRVVEFLMAIPAWILGNAQQPKKFVRHAAQGLLPALIIRRKTITTLRPMFNKGVLDKEFKKVKELLTDPSCEWQEYLQIKPINALLNQPNGNHSDKDCMLLWQCIGFELWRTKLNSVFFHKRRGD